MILMSPYQSTGAVYVPPSPFDARPLSTLSRANLVGTVSAIQDNPTNPDANWLTQGTMANTFVTVNFQARAEDVKETQTVEVLVRKSSSGGQNPTAVVLLLEGATVLATLVPSITVASEVGVLLSGTFDAGLLTDKTGANLRIQVDGTRSGGNTNNQRTVQVGAIRWTGVFGGTGSPPVSELSALVYPTPPWGFFNTSAEAVLQFADATDRNRLYSTGTTQVNHTLSLDHSVAGGQVRKLMLEFSGDNAETRFTVQFYNGGSSYAGRSAVLSSTTGVVDSAAETGSLGGQPTVITDLGSGRFRFEQTITIPSGVTVMQTRFLILDATSDFYISTGQSFFAGQMTFNAI